MNDDKTQRTYLFKRFKILRINILLHGVATDRFF